MTTPTALVTGASGGIGAAFARKLATEGHNLIIVARSEDKLNAIATDIRDQHGVQVHVFAMDLSTQQAPDELFAAITDAGLQVDVLINNAGYATYGHYWELERDREMRMIRLNVETLAHLTHLILPQMLQRRAGKILNVASTAAFVPGPLMSNYYATKAFVLSFSEGLAGELDGTGVTVTALCPGPTESGFQQRAEMTESKLVQSGLMTADDVVETGYKAMMRGTVVQIVGARNQMQMLSIRFMPRGMVRNTVKNMQQRVGH